MKQNLITKITLCGLILASSITQAQKTTLEVDIAKTVTKIQPNGGVILIN